MKQQSWQVKSALAAGIFSMSLLTGVASAAQQPASAPVHMVTDWTRGSVIYTNPDTPEEARAKGRYEQWQRQARDPRFMAAMYRKLEHQAFAGDRSAAMASPVNHAKPAPAPKPPPMHRDWSNITGGGTDGLGGVGVAATYPAKFSFDISATPSCANDFVVFTTATAGATSSGAQETRSSSFTGVPSSGDTLTFRTPNTGRTIVLTASATLNTGLNFGVGTTAAQAAANLTAAVNRSANITGITATNPSGGTVLFAHMTTGDTAGASGSFTLAESIGNYTITAANAATNGSGTPGQPTILALNQLYAGTCGAANPYAPSVFWSYNTGTGAVARTSPLISYYDGGLQVAFVQSNSSNQAQLVLLKWSSASPGTAAAPTTPSSVTLANYRSCTAPCMTVITFSGTPDDVFSSPFVDYTNDVAWVGDAAGKLHKFTGVFAGTPAEVTSGGFPATVSSGNALSPPVVDFGTGNILVGSASGAVTGGAIHRVDPSNGTVTSSAKIAVASDTGIFTWPIVDGNAGRAYVFVHSSALTNNPRAIYQFSTTFAAGTSGNASQAIGKSGAATNQVQHIGALDNIYYNTADSTSPTGNLYACGSGPTATNKAVLWKIPITANVMGTAAEGQTLSSAVPTGTDCSPLSEVPNGTHDYIFLSVPDKDSGFCATTSACIYSWDLNNLIGVGGSSSTWTNANGANHPVATLVVLGGGSGGSAGQGGTSAITVDNFSTLPGTSQVYFMNLGVGTNTVSNAVQASQAALQ